MTDLERKVREAQEIEKKLKELEITRQHPKRQELIELDRYKRLEKIGQGSYGSVFLVEDVKINMRLKISILLNIEKSI